MAQVGTVNAKIVTKVWFPLSNNSKARRWVAPPNKQCLKNSTKSGERKCLNVEKTVYPPIYFLLKLPLPAKNTQHRNNNHPCKIDHKIVTAQTVRKVKTSRRPSWDGEPTPIIRHIGKGIGFNSSFKLFNCNLVRRYTLI